MKLKDMQHERLIHLLVTLFFGLIFVQTMELATITGNAYLAALGLLLTILVVPYVWHYYKLENEVQARYKK